MYGSRKRSKEKTTYANTNMNTHTHNIQYIYILYDKDISMYSTCINNKLVRRRSAECMVFSSDYKRKGALDHFKNYLCGQFPSQSVNQSTSLL